MITHPQLVAHRGDRDRFPENTLPALEGALALGARFVEFDIQRAADGTAVLLHDASVERTGGQPGDARDLTGAELASLGVGEPQRFGTRYAAVTVPTLAAAVAVLNRDPAVTAFVEIKHESVERFGVEAVLEAAAQPLAAAGFNWVIISFLAEVVERARAQLACPIGWVVETYDASGRDAAQRMAPDYLFIGADAIPPGTDRLWPGPWRWVVYDVNEAALALTCAERGCGLVETDRLEALLQHPALQVRQP